MNNLIVEVKDFEESNKVVQMMVELSKGEGVDLGERLGIVVLANGKIYEDRVQFKEHYLQTYKAEEITVAQLKDLVALNRVKLNTENTDMKNIKVSVTINTVEEVLDSLVELGMNLVLTKNKLIEEVKNGTVAVVVLDGDVATTCNPNTYDCKELTIPQLRDLVVLKRNDVADATHTNGNHKYYLTSNEFYKYFNNKWVNVDEFVDGMSFYQVEKKNMKEFLVFHNDKWTLQLLDADTEENSFRVIVPNGAEVLTGLVDDKYSLVFWKPSVGEVYQDGAFKNYSFHNSMSYEEYTSNWIRDHVLWQRTHPEDEQLPVTPIEQGSREQFEQIDEIAERIKSTDAFYCRKGNWYICPNDDNREDEAFLDGAWMIYQKLKGV